MIKNWKLFLEASEQSNSRDQEILDNIKDILLPLKDSCELIRVYIPNYVEGTGEIKILPEYLLYKNNDYPVLKYYNHDKVGNVFKTGDLICTGINDYD